VLDYPARSQDRYSCQRSNRIARSRLWLHAGIAYEQIVHVVGFEVRIDHRRPGVRAGLAGADGMSDVVNGRHAVAVLFLCAHLPEDFERTLASVAEPLLDFLIALIFHL